MAGHSVLRFAQGHAVALILLFIMGGVRMATASTLAADIVINGGSFSAPAVALAAARTSPTATILLLEPTDWLGGQATSQGVAAIDNAWHAPAAALMRDNPSLYYPADYLEFLNRMRIPLPASAPGRGLAPAGTCWVSREAFDPRTAAWVLDQMMSDYPNITVLKMTVVKSLATAAVSDEFGTGAVITSLTLIRRHPVGGYVPHTKLTSHEIGDWYSATNSPDFTKTVITVTPRDLARGLVVVEASELGDTMVLSGAIYTVGRELTTEEMSEAGVPPACDEDGSQATVYPFCMSDAPASATEAELKTDFPAFDDYYTSQVANYFSLGSFSWARVWTYRRLLTTGPLYANDTVSPGDVSMQNWYPGNDYPYASFYLNRAEAASQLVDWRGGVDPGRLFEAEKHAVAWYFYMKANRTSVWDTRYLRGSDPLNMMGTGHGLAKFPYIRCSRRGIGLHNFRLTSRYFVNTQAAGYSGGTSYRFYDSVGIGNYAVDIHPTQVSTGLSPAFTYAAPFYIPYRALGSANIRNLLLAGKNIATTYISNAAYRLHPIEWAIGSAAGTAASVMARDGLTNYHLLETPTLRSLQAAIALNSPIHWAAFDTSPTVARNGDLIVNDLKPIQAGVPFRAEVYHHRGARARLFLGATLMGETTVRANGRLLLTGLTAPAGSSGFVAYVYDDSGNLMDIIPQLAGVGDLMIVDNTDPRFSVTGSWTVASAQPDKYGGTYAYSWGYSGPSTATWLLSIPSAGLYEVFVWYPQASNRATDAPFTVHHAEGQTTVRINQQINGGQWVRLGTFRFSGAGGDRVVLSNSISDTTKLVVADAVRISGPLNAGVAEWDRQ
jgi:hypothetical protein